MPSPSDFRKAFGLQTGSQLGQFKIAGSHLGHDVKEQNEQYEFPATLELEWAPGTPATGKRLEERRRAAEASFQEQCGGEHVVYSAYGTARGVAVRRRDIPTLAAAKARERQAAGAAEELSKEDEARWLRGCRVIKSRFGTSKCWLCGETIDPGQKIAKRQSAAGRGGWAHAACLVHQRKGGGGGSAGQQEDEEAEEGGEGGEGSVEEEAPLPRKRKGGAAARSRKASSRAKRRRASEE